LVLAAELFSKPPVLNPGRVCWLLVQFQRSACSEADEDPNSTRATCLISSVSERNGGEAADLELFSVGLSSLTHPLRTTSSSNGHRPVLLQDLMITSGVNRLVDYFCNNLLDAPFGQLTKRARQELTYSRRATANLRLNTANARHHPMAE
jgi:hypothetical protein